MNKAAVFAIAGIIVAGGVAGFLFLNRGDRMGLQGSVMKVRTHSLDENNSLAIVDFRVTNTGDYHFAVKEVTVTLEDAAGVKSTGTVLTEMDAKRFLDYYKELGPKYNDSLIPRSKIEGKQTADRMAAVSFQVPVAKLEERKRILIKIADVDGPTAEVAEAPRN